jgi:diamine N-acetyltransferase
MDITLREITADIVVRVAELTVKQDQEHFVAANVVSLEQGQRSEEAWYRAVFEGERLVGFVMLYDESLRKVPPPSPKLILWRLMIDHRYQKRGIGRKVIGLILDYARSKGCFSDLLTSYVPGEGSAGGFYLSLGFQPTGEVDEGEIVVKYSLEA